MSGKELKTLHLARARWPWAPIIAPHLRQPGRAEKWLFSRLPE